MKMISSKPDWSNCVAGCIAVKQQALQIHHVYFLFLKTWRKYVLEANPCSGWSHANLIIQMRDEIWEINLMIKYRTNFPHVSFIPTLNQFYYISQECISKKLLRGQKQFVRPWSWRKRKCVHRRAARLQMDMLCAWTHCRAALWHKIPRRLACPASQRWQRADSEIGSCILRT